MYALQVVRIGVPVDVVSDRRRNDSSERDHESVGINGHPCDADERDDRSQQCPLVEHLKPMRSGQQRRCQWNRREHDRGHASGHLGQRPVDQPLAATARLAITVTRCAR